MSKFDLFSGLSQGYGTYDGIAKKESIEIDNEIFSLDDLRLPPIANNYEKADKTSIAYKKTFEPKPLKLPVVQAQPLHKTFTTRKGALLLYSENYFLPGSPKAKKRRRKLKQQSAVKLKTLTDLRDFILNYKRNGGDPLFLALLQKRLSSGYFGNNVRPGFSPKRYIATLGRSLQEESWNKLLSSGSFKDPALQTYNPYVSPIHDDGSRCELFPSKPQPYTTMSLPPISPSGSMLGSNFNFYPNGMSTGAASMISINSEEYAPSSRAISPGESLNDRLTEVEPIKPKQDHRYALLDSKQKEHLLSQMLVQKTLETVDSDLQTWPTAFTKDETLDSSSSVTVGSQKRKNSKGSLKSSSLTSIPRLPPIQSAGGRLTTPSDILLEDGTPSRSSRISTMNEAIHSIGPTMSQSSNQSKSSTRRVSEPDLDTFRRKSSALHDPRESRDVVDPGGVEIDLSDESSHWDDALTRVNDNNTGEGQEEQKALDLVETLGKSRHDDEAGETEEDKHSESYNETSTSQQDNVVNHQDFQENIINQTFDKESETEAEKCDMQSKLQNENLEDERESDSSVSDGELEKSDDKEGDEEEFQKSVDGAHTRSTTSLSIFEDQGPSPEPPPPITFEQLHSEARAVASRVLNRPQSGTNFMEDARTALAMWSDRLTTLLDPPNKDARTTSAAVNRVTANKNPIGSRASLVARKRKISQSAGPSLAALRQALLISGGEIPGVEKLKSLPPIRIPQVAPTRSAHGSAVSRDSRTQFEPLKDESTRYSRASGSVGQKSVLTERISMSDLQIDIMNFVSDDELGLIHDRARTVQDDESEDEDFRAALEAVVTDIQRNITSGKKKTITEPKASSPAKEEKQKPIKSHPFQVKRPIDERPPPGLETKIKDAVPKGKETKGAFKKPAKKAPKKTSKVAKKVIEKPKTEKTTKKTSKKADSSKESVPKPLEDSPEEVKEISEPHSLSPVASIRATSGFTDAETPTQESDTRSVLDSSMRSDSEQQQFSTKSASLQSVRSIAAPVIEQPRLVPKPPEPEEPQVDLEEERKEKERLEAELEKKREKEQRAAKRAEERAAAAERRRQEVERKRREKEEAKRRQLEEEARLERVRQEAEEEMKKREMEMRKKREEREEEKRRKEEEEQRKEREERTRIEREKRQREEFERKKQELIAQRKLEEEIRKEQEKLEAEIEEANRRAEEERLQAMEESERIALQEKMRREEEVLRRRLEAERKIQEEQRRIQEEQQRMREEAIALLRQKRLQRQLFVTGLIKEGMYMSLSQRLSRAFTFSYFDKLPWGFLNHMRSMSPMKEMIKELKENQIPPTIYELEEEEENIN